MFTVMLATIEGFSDASFTVLYLCTFVIDIVAFMCIESVKK